MARTTFTVNVDGDGWVTIEGPEIAVEARSIPQALRNLADVLDRRTELPTAPVRDQGPRPRNALRGPR